MNCKKYIFDALETVLRFRYNGWFQSKDLVKDVSKVLGEPISSRRISKHLARLLEENKVKRRKITGTLHEYKSLLIPNCCEYSHITIDINPIYCVNCGTPFRVAGGC